MKYSLGRVAVWLVVYVASVLGFLLLAVVGPVPEPRPFLSELGVALGFVGIGILAMQFVTTGRFRVIAPVFGADVVLQFHRQAGIVGFALVLAHPVLLIISDPDYLQFFDPRVNLPRSVALVAVVPALVMLLVTSLWRERVGLNYEWWRATHGVLSLAVVFIGMVHGIQVGAYLGELWKQAIWTAVLLGAMYLVVHARIIRPGLMKRRPYRVVDVREELEDTHTLVLEPVGHSGMRFTAGQYAWITVGDSPYSWQQHPFSFSSSEHDDTISFTAKELGDFTATWGDIPIGQTAFLEGPYGGFTLDADSAGPVFIVGGIGVTPAMSILRTMRDRGDERPAMLLYGNPTVDDIVFEDELRQLEQDMNLTVVHVVEDPPDDWQGESGLMDREMLDRDLPDDRDTFEYFICGPEPMTDAVEPALRELGMSWRQIYTERFEIV